MDTLRRIAILAGAGVLSGVGLAQAQHQTSSTFTVMGHSGQAPVIQKDGRSYVDVEGLARLTGGTLGFQGSQIVLTLPGTHVQPSAPHPAPTEHTGFSGDFLRAGVEGMSEI